MPAIFTAFDRIGIQWNDRNPDAAGFFLAYRSLSGRPDRIEFAAPLRRRFQYRP